MVRNINISNWIKNNYLITLIILVGIVLRLYKIDDNLLSHHELVTQCIMYYDQSLLEFFKVVGLDNSPPLYHLLTKLVLLVTGPELALNHGVLRFSSAVFGILNIFIVYVLFKSRFGKKIAILSSLQQAFFVTMIFYSAHARSSAMFVFLSTISFVIWIDGLKEADKSNKHFLIFGLINFLNMMTHYFGIIFFLCQLPFLLYANKGRNLLSYAVVTFVVVLLYFPWANEYVLARIFTMEDFWIPPVSMKSFIKIFSHFTSSFYLFELMCLVFIERIYNFFRDRKKLRRDSVSLYPILFIFVFILAVAVKSIFSTSVFLERYFICLYPILFLVFSDAILKSKNSKYFAMAMVLILINSWTLTQQHSNFFWYSENGLDPSRVDCNRFHIVKPEARETN
jgi:4-amino-4-deoxy-L-arabinose transferase-like glycosyltransferase